MRNINTNAVPKPTLENLLVCKQEVEELLEEYGSVLAPRIIEYEVEKCEFPIEVLNEIRAIYAHLYRASVTSRPEDIGENISKAKSHSKRAILDCYKYLCVHYDDYYHQFFKKFGYINWSKSRLNDKIKQIDFQRQHAVEALRLAKLRESTSESARTKEDDYRNLYQKAYEEYLELVKMTYELEKNIESSPKVVSRFPALAYTMVGVCGIVIGVILGLLFF